MTAWIELPGGIRLGQLIGSTIVCTLTWSLVLLLHAYQHRKNGFNIRIWLGERQATFAVGLAVTLIIALLRAFTKDMGQLLSLMGFQPGPSAAISVGLAIAALLLGFKPTGKPKDEKETDSHIKT
jgi:hypothetical protein